MSNDNLSRQALGKKGEELALRHITQLGWKLVAQNWRCEHGELDIIAQDDKTLVFIEVRTRRGKTALETALASVNQRKRERLAQLVDAYCLTEEIAETTPVRVDVIGIALEADGLFTIEVVKDALSW